MCAECGSLLETNADIDISTVIEDCPNCGAFLANTLKKRYSVETKTRPPKFQTAFDLTKFKIDIEKISKFMPLSTTGALCIAGHNANLLLTRLCVRALLPANHGGLDSPHVIIIDAGNKSDFYKTVHFCKQYGLDLNTALDRIIVSRTFTIHQLKSLLLRELPKIVQKYRPSVVIVPGLLDLFDDSNIKKKEAKKVIPRIMQSIKDVSDRLLVIASFQESKYIDLVIPSFDKRIVLSDLKHGKLNAELYNAGKTAAVSLTNKDLKIARRR